MTIEIWGPFVIIVLGVFLVIGTILRWNFLVDPPEEWAWIYSHSAIKKHFGSDFLVGYNYVIGVALMVLGLYFFYAAITGKIN